MSLKEIQKGFEIDLRGEISNKVWGTFPFKKFMNLKGIEEKSGEI
jgi:hypothetical protein